MKSIDQVRQFHEAFGVQIQPEPYIYNEEINALRLDLIQEETSELAEALAAKDSVAALDALTDLQYVLDGAFLALGFHPFKDAAMDEVHRSNMAKLGKDGKPIHRSDGKIMKPEGWAPPDLESILAARGRADKSDGWRDWSGGAQCPVDEFALIIAKLKDGEEYKNHAAEFDWTTVSSYRVLTCEWQAPVADDGWIEWKGGECPVDHRARIDIRLADGSEHLNQDSHWCWSHDQGDGNITAYRLAK